MTPAIFALFANYPLRSWLKVGSAALIAVLSL